MHLLHNVIYHVTNIADVKGKTNAGVSVTDGTTGSWNAYQGNIWDMTNYLHLLLWHTCNLPMEQN
jgi:hypothetical protein